MVKIGAAGLCHSDLSVIDGNRPRPTRMVLAELPALSKARTSVDDLKVGDHVVMVFVPSYGHCLPVRRDVLPCASPAPLPTTRGHCFRGRAAYIATAATFIIILGAPRLLNTQRSRAGPWSKIDQELPFDEAALFGCAVLTGVGAVINTAKVSGGFERCCDRSRRRWLKFAFGSGRGRRPRIVAVDLSDDKLGLARQLGATDRFDPGNPSAIDEIRSATAGGVEFTLRWRAPVEAINIAYKITRRGGNHYHGGVASTQSYICAASGKSCRRGANHRGQLHRHLCPFAIFPATSGSIEAASCPSIV